MPRVQLYVNACNGWPQFALQHRWLLPINCHFQDCTARLVTVIYCASSALYKNPTFTLFTFYCLPTSSRIQFKLCTLMFDVQHDKASQYVTQLSCHCCDDGRVLRSLARGNFVARRKERKRTVFSAFLYTMYISKRSGMDHIIISANTPCLPILRKRSPDGATPNSGRRHSIAAYTTRLSTRKG